MTDFLLDSRMITSVMFYPRTAAPGGSRVGQDGTFPAADPAFQLGYRLYSARADAPLVVFWHGNGEIAADYDALAPLFTGHAGVSLLVVDFRGYGWSTGAPLGSALLTDAEALVRALPNLRARHGLSPRATFAMGRSLGSASAIHAAHACAHSAPETFRGLILDSAFFHGPSLLLRLGVLKGITAGLPDPLGNGRKIADLTLPLLVIHGQQDTLIPPDNARKLHDASPAAHKRLLLIRGAGHNDLLLWGMDAYFDALRAFVA